MPVLRWMPTNTEFGIMKHERITDHVNYLRRKRIYNGKSFPFCFLVVEWKHHSSLHHFTAMHDTNTCSEFKFRCPEMCAACIRMKSEGERTRAGRKIIIHSVLCRFFMSTMVPFKNNGTGVQQHILQTHIAPIRKLSSECIASLIDA